MTEMLEEIIRELTKAKGNVTITSENVLTWDKRVEAQRAQSAVMSTITEMNEFDKMKVAKYTHKNTAKRIIQTRTPTMQTCRCCGSTHPQDSAQHMGRCVWYAAKLATSEWYVGAKGPEL